jgi:tetratricopeptide (TPR) repeat protein
MSEPLPPMELAWSLHARVMAAFEKPARELETTIHQAASPAALADANDPARFQRACMLGMASVTDLALDDALPEPVRASLRELPIHYQELLNILSPAAHAITAAAPDLRTITNIEGVTGLLHGAAQAANPSTTIGVATIGGATLGSLVLPGIGTAIGGAIGVWLGGMQTGKRDRRAVERFAEAVKLMWAAVGDLQRSLWNQVIRSVKTQNGPALPDAAYFETAGVQWVSLRATLEQTARSGDTTAERARLETYVREWGPHPDALAFAVRLRLPPHPADAARAAAFVAQHSALYPTDPHGWENQARLSLESGDFAAALEAAEQGLKADAAHAGARDVRLETLAALGRIGEAEDAARAARASRPGTAPELVLIRGLMRGDRRAEAIERVRAWARRDGRPAAIVRHLRAFAPTASLLAAGAEPIPELTSVPPGVDGEMQAAVEQHLRADGARSYLGQPPAEQAQNARDAFLQLQPDERLLFFHDWSLFHNAKTGLALTTRRLLWKAGWQDAVIIDLRQARDTPVRAEKAVLHVGGKTVDVEDERLAAGLAASLREMFETLHATG